jgi:hypothetical protein
MEYPMVSFNYGRPEKDGTYSDRTKYGMIGVIIHEIGHYYFPMIVNSDERQWTWMDEGLNTFLQYLTEQEWERDYPSRRGPPANMVNYMRGDKERISPIMTNSESIWQFGNNAYGKPATALNILRETVMGRELFDYAFKTYAQRWMFKHPTPADFFRTMEDASGVDLDWFWRGWFYTNDHVDQAITDVKWYTVNTGDPEVEKAFEREQDARQPDNISDIRDDQQGAIEETYTERVPEANDFYNRYDPYEVTPVDVMEYEQYLATLSDEDKKWLEAGYNYYEITIENIGELVMPIILKLNYTDGTSEEKRIPAEIWRRNDEVASKVYYSKKELQSVELDPYVEIVDVDRSNNYWPERHVPNRFELYKQRSRGGGENTMQRIRRGEQMNE